MTRTRARNLFIAVGGVLLLIAVGFMRDGLGGEDSGFDIIARDDSADGDEFAGESGQFADGSGKEQGEAVGFEDSSVAVGGTATRSGAGSMGSSSSSGSGSGSGGGSGASYASSDGGDSAVSSVPLPPLQDSERIIKDGRIQVEVPKGGFDRAFAAVLGLAAKADGQVVSSQSSREEDHASGEITIRVPAQRFEQLLASTQGVGTIESREITSQDVSGEFVDLQSRLRHLQAQEQFYLGLLSKARVVGDAIAINQHLSTVQAEMEQVQGRLRLLDERSTYSRLTIALHEPGVTLLTGDPFAERRGALGQAWADAVLALQETIGALLVGVFTMAPVLVLALIGWALWRRLRPRPADPQDPRPAVEEETGPLPVG